MQRGTVSTNVFLRKLHNFCLDMSWLPWPVIPKRQWPAVRNYSGCFCWLRQEGVAIEGAAEIFQNWEAVFAEG